MTTNPLLLAAIAERSSTHLRIYSDWLEERGEPLAVGWRLLAESGKWPEFLDGNTRAHWNMEGGMFDFSGTIDADVFVAIKDGKYGIVGDAYFGNSFVAFPGVAAALTAAARAFEQIAREP